MATRCRCPARRPWRGGAAAGRGVWPTPAVTTPRNPEGVGLKATKARWPARRPAAAGTGAQTLPADTGLYGMDFELGLQRRERWLDLLEPARPARPEGHWEPGPYGC